MAAPFIRCLNSRSEPAWPPNRRAIGGLGGTAFGYQPIMWLKRRRSIRTASAGTPTARSSARHSSSVQHLRQDTTPSQATMNGATGISQHQMTRRQRPEASGAK